MGGAVSAQTVACLLVALAPNQESVPPRPLAPLPPPCRSFAQHYGGYGEDEGPSSAVGQQALLPTSSDPKLWVVRCGEGQERELVSSVLQKCYDYAAKGTPLLIKAAFCQDHLKVGG